MFHIKGEIELSDLITLSHHSYNPLINHADIFWRKLFDSIYPNTQVPLSEDDCALSSGYAAAMDAAMHGNHCVPGHHQEPDDTTPSDLSERPSVDDVESDTGSTGALETRSLKDHKGNTVAVVSEVPLTSISNVLMFV